MLESLVKALLTFGGFSLGVTLLIVAQFLGRLSRGPIAPATAKLPERYLPVFWAILSGLFLLSFQAIAVIFPGRSLLVWLALAAFLGVLAIPLARSPFPPPRSTLGNLAVRFFGAIAFLFTSQATATLVPFWTAYTPLVDISLGFALFLLIGPLLIFDWSMLGVIYFCQVQERSPLNRRMNAGLFLAISLGAIALSIGLIHSHYISDPLVDFNLYRSDREAVVRWVETTQPKGSNNCFLDSTLQILEKFDAICRDTIALPPQYQGLSRNGTLEILKTADNLALVFTHSTRSFKDVRTTFVYHQNPASPLTQLDEKISDRWHFKYQY